MIFASVTPICSSHESPSQGFICDHGKYENIFVPKTQKILALKPLQQFQLAASTHRNPTVAKGYRKILLLLQWTPCRDSLD
jgi:hypothetical protein